MSSATANYWFRPSATLIQLTRRSSNCWNQRQYSPCQINPHRVGSWSLRLSGGELADQLGKLSAAGTQPDNALESVIRRALIRRSSRPPPIQYERLKEVCTSLIDDQIETSFAKTERSEFNAHHVSWDEYAQGMPLGAELNNWIEENEMAVLNDGKPTRAARFQQECGLSAPDITIVISEAAERSS